MKQLVSFLGFNDDSDDQVALFLGVDDYARFEIPLISLRWVPDQEELSWDGLYLIEPGDMFTTITREGTIQREKTVSVTVEIDYPTLGS